MAAHHEAMARHRDEMGITALLERAQPARIIVETIAEGDDLGDMVCCTGCLYQGRCKFYVRDLAAVAQRCAHHQPKGGR